MAAQRRVAQLNKPVGITMDAAGNIYVADVNNSRIRKILTDGTITTIAGKRRSWLTAEMAEALPRR